MFGLSVHSEVPLPGFPATSNEPDVEIRYGSVAFEAVPTSERLVRSRFKDDFFEADLLFEIANGTTVTVDPRGEIELKVLQAWVIKLMAVVLRQRGCTVLHGSAVARNGMAVAFLGESGWGKSTLAEYFVQHGYTFLTDDMLVMDTDHVPPSVWPGPQFIRLHADVGSKFVADFDGLPLVSERLSKRSRFIDREAGTAIPIGKIYVLDKEAADSNRVEHVGNQEAILHLLTHTQAKDLLVDSNSASKLLMVYAKLLAQVPISKLRRIRSLDALGDLVATVEHDVNETNQVGE